MANDELTELATIAVGLSRAIHHPSLTIHFMTVTVFDLPMLKEES
jgi:hypothetical protein